jgi:hypothetical protein
VFRQAIIIKELWAAACCSVSCACCVVMFACWASALALLPPASCLCVDLCVDLHPCTAVPHGAPAVAAAGHTGGPTRKGVSWHQRPLGSASVLPNAGYGRELHTGQGPGARRAGMCRRAAASLCFNISGTHSVLLESDLSVLRGCTQLRYLKCVPECAAVAEPTLEALGLSGLGCQWLKANG